MNGNRRQFLAATATVSVASVVGVHSALADSEENDTTEQYDLVTVPGGKTHEVALAEGDTYENKVIDISADRAEFEITTQGNSCTIRNIGIKGEWDATFTAQPITAWTDEADGEVLIENIYFADGATASQFPHGPAGVFVPAQHAGTVTARHLNIQGLAFGGVNAAAPGREGSPAGNGGDVIVENSYAADIEPAAYRVGTDGSRVENCVAVNAERGGWAEYNSPTFVDCDFSKSERADVFAVDSEEGPASTAVLENVRGETTEGDIDGELAGAAERTDPSEVEGVPLTPEEAAGGERSVETVDLGVTTKNSESEALAGAEVVVEPTESDDNTDVREDVTGDDGYVAFTDLTTGQYEVSATYGKTDDDGENDENQEPDDDSGSSQDDDQEDGTDDGQDDGSNDDSDGGDDDNSNDDTGDDDNSNDGGKTVLTGALTVDLNSDKDVDLILTEDDQEDSEGGEYDLYVTVESPLGEPIADADVLVENMTNDEEYEDVTGEEGETVFESLAEARYLITATAEESEMPDDDDSDDDNSDDDDSNDDSDDDNSDDNNRDDDNSDDDNSDDDGDDGEDDAEVVAQDLRGIQDVTLDEEKDVTVVLGEDRSDDDDGQDDDEKDDDGNNDDDSDCSDPGSDPSCGDGGLFGDDGIFDEDGLFGEGGIFGGDEGLFGGNGIFGDDGLFA